MALFSDLATDVVARMGNRTDITTRSQYWVFEAVLQLTSEIEFDELNVTGANASLADADDTYALSDFITAGDTLLSIIDFILYTDYPTNTQTIRLRKSDIKELDKIMPIEGAWPTNWARFGSNIVVRPVPNGTYNMYMRYQKQHPLTGSVPYSGTTLVLPIEWELPIKYLAMSMGYDELKEHDRAQMCKAQVWGGWDPVAQREIVGLVKRLQTKNEREVPRYDYGLRPVVYPTCAR